MSVFLILTASASSTPPQPVPIQEMITEYAHLYGLKEDRFRATIKCESNFNPLAIGDHGQSHGLVQIHLPSWPTVTKAQAQDPDFALRFMAQKWAEGKHKLWSCWRILYGT